MSNDIERAFNQALTSPRGVRLRFASESVARSFRIRAYKVRARDRQRDPDGISEWDDLMLTLEDKSVLITRPTPEIEEL